MRRVAIAAGSQVAADAGADVADHGGNAVDAAVAATLVGMCTDPGIIAPGGSAFITVWPPGEAPVVLDAYAAVPGKGLDDPPEGFGDRVAMAYGGGMETLVGHGSVAVPGAFAGLGEAGERYGRLSWPETMRPAIEVAERGFPLSATAAAYLTYSHEPIFDRQEESFRALHHADGTPLLEGEIVLIEGLADALGSIADGGPEVMATGAIGRALAAEMAANGGRITAEDLAGYRPILREPVIVPADEWTVATNPAPAIGGATMAAMLLLADDHPFTAWTPDEVRRLASIQRAVLGYRARHLDDAGDREAAVAALLDAARVGDRRSLLDAPSTIHTSAVDTDGLACAITASAGYGSGVMIPGTGMWLNNSLGELELAPQGMGRFAPGDRLPSNMAPTVARRSDGAVLAIGSPGASRITTAISQVLLNAFHLGMSLRDAVEHPRLHVEVFEGEPTIAFEPGLPVEAFDGMGVRRFPDLSMYFGGVGVALFDPAAGLFQVADSRRALGAASGGST
ncbi:MAG: gamma-glutamyltransferase [Actinobacteria bacterium]|nr:gamma-glutamyltransferase [Actinomycetota bacterium]